VSGSLRTPVVALAGLAWIVLVLTSSGCGSKEEKPVDRTHLSVGAHDLSVVVPPELESIDLGSTVEMRTRGGWPGDASFERIAFQDLGPVRRNGEPLDSVAFDALGPGGLDSLAEAALIRLGYDGRIEVKGRRALEVGGRPAVSFDTWYRSTHQTYRRVAIIRNGSSLLAVEAQQGVWEIVGKHFGDVLLSVVFGPQPPAGSASSR
jgi:hypothetical protein